MQYTNVKDKYLLFYEQDELMRSQLEGNTSWTVELNNGLKIYQDDFREYPQFQDERKYSTWVRLRDYCLKENVKIVKMWIQFRTNFQYLPANADGYYFCKSALGAFGTTETFHFFVTGHVEEGIIKVRKFKTPELILTDEEVRTVREDDLCLILNKRTKNELHITS
jgi:hypothetical protein